MIHPSLAGIHWIIVTMRYWWVNQKGLPHFWWNADLRLYKTHIKRNVLS